jgi:serine/threonine protein kinase
MTAKVPTSFRERLQASRLLTAEQMARACAVAGEDEPHLSRYLVQEGLLTRFQARQLRFGATSFYVDKYVVVDYLGRGGHSVVYKARHTLLTDRYVALKTLDLRNMHQSDGARERFQSEVQLIAQLNHRNIVRAYDVIETRTQLYLVLEYVDGYDLGKLVAQLGPLAIPDAVRYTIQAAQGLAHAHRHGIVHRDLKPANLLLARDGTVKLADLGLARFLTPEPTPEGAANGGCLGTPEFMAPEQAVNAVRVDARSDLYSLGNTLFHLLTGELPVKGGSYFNKLKQLLTIPPRSLAEARADVPPALAAVVERLRAREPAKRPARAEEAIALLAPFAGAAPDDRPGQWEGRHKAALVLEVLQGRTTAEEACQRYNLRPEEFKQWRQCFLEGATRALESTSSSTGREMMIPRKRR